MKPYVILLFLLSAVLFSCSKDNDPSATKLNHVGQKWRITSVEYTIVDQGLSNPMEWVKTGSATDAGAFYFDGSDGSFDIIIDKKRTEDYFGYTESESGVNIITVEQSLSGLRFSQNIIAISGDKSGSVMTLSGTITKQNVAQQYVFTGDFVLTKE